MQTFVLLKANGNIVESALQTKLLLELQASTTSAAFALAFERLTHRAYLFFGSQL